MEIAHPAEGGLGSLAHIHGWYRTGLPAPVEVPVGGVVEVDEPLLLAARSAEDDLFKLQVLLLLLQLSQLTRSIRPGFNQTAWHPSVPIIA